MSAQAMDAPPPGGALPPSALPPGALPPGTLPPGALPPSAQHPGAHSAGAHGMGAASLGAQAGGQPPGGALPPGAQPPGVSEQAPATPDATAPDGAAPPRRSRRRRTALIAAGAILASLLTTAAQSYDGYLFYEMKMDSRKDTKHTIVAAGQAGQAHNIEYKATITKTEAPANSKLREGVTWLKIVITKKLLNESSATMTGPPSEYKLTDTKGRTWAVEAQAVGDPPLDKLEMGKEYRIEGLAIVPSPVANEVELSFRPSTYRSDTPTEDLFDREAMEKAEKDDVVLVFRRR
ncbi:hypothetical protein GCM10009850_106720 [Nonomuraea monospora]|uniref:DUF4352 domain-containing protein n=1 Tax=Nonomuraea monospora TaxID=568818 RepID=A0ABP5PTZ7_9ACTN